MIDWRIIFQVPHVAVTSPASQPIQQPPQAAHQQAMVQTQHPGGQQQMWIVGPPHLAQQQSVPAQFITTVPSAHLPSPTPMTNVVPQQKGQHTPVAYVTQQATRPCELKFCIALISDCLIVDPCKDLECPVDAIFMNVYAILFAIYDRQSNWYERRPILKRLRIWRIIPNIIFISCIPHNDLSVEVLSSAIPGSPVCLALWQALCFSTFRYLVTQPFYRDGDWACNFLHERQQYTWLFDLWQRYHTSNMLDELC